MTERTETAATSRLVCFPELEGGSYSGTAMQKHGRTFAIDLVRFGVDNRAGRYAPAIYAPTIIVIACPSI